MIRPPVGVRTWSVTVLAESICPPESFHPGDVLVGKYRIDGILGEGGMGVVLAAQHLELDQTVAIKVLHQEAADYSESEERFRREARVAAKIQSDHVTRVLDVGRLDSGTRFMVMEHLEGRDLAEELAERGRFSIGSACALMLEALDAVSSAHEAGIVHRDIKPENLFLSRRADGGLRLKVLDFGISKIMGEGDSLSLTKTSEWMGTPLYMSPEQMQSPKSADARSDVWSLGAVLYELLSGQPPYPAESLPALCTALLTRDAQDIRELAPEVPAELAEIIMTCLQRDINLRTQTASAFAEGLARFATGLSAHSRRPSSFAATAISTTPVARSQIRALSRLSSQAPSSQVEEAFPQPRPRSRFLAFPVLMALLLAAAAGGYALSHQGLLAPDRFEQAAPAESETPVQKPAGSTSSSEGTASALPGKSPRAVGESERGEPAVEVVEPSSEESAPAPVEVAPPAPRAVTAQPVRSKRAPRAPSAPTPPRARSSAANEKVDTPPEESVVDYSEFGGRR